MVSDFFTRLFLESGIGLCLDHLLEKSRINRPNDINEKLSGRPLLGREFVVHVLLDLRIVLDLLYQVVHAKLIVERQCDSIDLVVLEAELVTSENLTDELTVDLVILVKVALAKRKKVNMMDDHTYHWTVRYW